MFPSVKDRARQLFGETALPADAPPPPPVATGRRGAPPPKAAAATKATPEPKTPLKGSRAAAQAKKDVAAKVEETPKPVGAWPSPLEQFKARSSPPTKTNAPPAPAKTTSSSKAAAALKAAALSKPSSPISSKPEKSSKSEKPSKSEKSEKSEKSAEKPKKSEKKSSKSSDKERESKKSSRPKTPPTPKAAAPSGGLFSRWAPETKPEPKPAAPSKKSSSSRPASELKKEKPSRPTLSTRASSRPKIERTSSSSSLDSDAEPDDLRAACLREASKISGLKGKELAISLRQRSSGGWYAALKDVGADKYLKMWMNRDKTFATQEEALQAYLVFVKKMNTDMKLFGPMSPKSGKGKGFF